MRRRDSQAELAEICGQCRTRRKFLWWPRIGYDTREGVIYWLEFANVREVVINYTYTDSDGNQLPMYRWEEIGIVP
jgi:hypothetical protein